MFGNATDGQFVSNAMIKKHGRPREGGTQFDTGVVPSCIDHSSEEEEGQVEEKQDAGRDNSGGNAEGGECSGCGGDSGSSNGGAKK